MNYQELKKRICKTGLTIKEFAILLRLNPNTITNLSKKEEMPRNLVIIVSLMVKMEENKLEYLGIFEELNLKENKPRGKKAEKEKTTQPKYAGNPPRKINTN